MSLRENFMKKIKFLAVVLLAFILLYGCTEAERVSSNVSQQADNFNVIRRLTVLNARSDKPLFELVGAFSFTLENIKNIL